MVSKEVVLLRRLGERLMKYTDLVLSDWVGEGDLPPSSIILVENQIFKQTHNSVFRLKQSILKFEYSVLLKMGLSQQDCALKYLRSLGIFWLFAAFYLFF